jgi:hypothetical protein
MSAKSGEAHGDWQFLDPVRDILSNEDKDSLGHNSKVRGNPLGVTHQLRGSREQAQCVPLHKRMRLAFKREFPSGPAMLGRRSCQGWSTNETLTGSLNGILF